MGVRLISFDRPGYGSSDRLVARRVADVAADVGSIADELGLDSFAVLGRSGGGPHALACAALLPGRVRRVGALVSLAPWEAEGLDWFAGMADSNVGSYTDAAFAPELLAARLVRTAARIVADPASHLAELDRELPEVDRQVVRDVGLRKLLAMNFAEALRYSAAGWIDDALAFCSPWGFDPADVVAPVLLWHGAEDVLSPVSHTYWLASKIVGSRVQIEPGAAHFGAFQVVLEVLAWLISPF
jgi:pimeloyl-ACP methyl ester carboxylesterase